MGFLKPIRAKRRLTGIKEDEVCIVKALIDTGATGSCITSRVARALDISPEEGCLVSGGHGAKWSNTYYVALAIPQINLIRRKMTVIEADFSEHDECQAIIGMDILSQGSFHFDYAGSFIFCV